MVHVGFFGRSYLVNRMDIGIPFLSFILDRVAKGLRYLVIYSSSEGKLSSCRCGRILKVYVLLGDTLWINGSHFYLSYPEYRNMDWFRTN